MKAVTVDRYGPPEILAYEEVQVPTPGPDEVLVRVRAVSANPADWRRLRANPFFIRLMGDGLLRPRHRILGTDVAGRVESIGRDVRGFAPGDDVFGAARYGGFAEYAVVPQERLQPKPTEVGFEEAAAVPVAGVTALQGLRDQAGLQTGESVLVHGASGGVGTFAVQIAKALGATVTGVCSTANVELVRSLGADDVVDYTREDITRSDRAFDVILDAAAYRPVPEYLRILSPKGRYVLVGGTVKEMFRVLLFGSRLSRGGPTVSFLMAEIRKQDLATLRELLESGAVTPAVGRRFRLSEVPDALRFLEEGHPRGKVIITV